MDLDHPNTPTANGRRSPPEWRESAPDRDLLLIRNLTLVYTLDGRRLPDLATEPDAAAALLDGWRVATADIPVGWLDRVFALAIRAHTSDYPLRPGEIRKAWESTAAERDEQARARALPAGPTGAPCPTCAGSPGWLRHDAPVGAPLFGQMYPCPDCHGTGAGAGPIPAVSPPRPPTPAELHRLEAQIAQMAAQHRDPGQVARARAIPAGPPAREFLRPADDPAVLAAVASVLDPQGQGAADTTRLPGPVRSSALVPERTDTR